MRLTIGQKLSGGFGTMVLLAVLVAVVVFSEAGALQTRAQDAVASTIPAAESAAEIQGEIHHTLSMHRGYMILGLPVLAEERLEAWAKIDKASARMDAIAVGWDDNALRAQWTEAKRVMRDFRAAQDRIAAVAHTPADYPANEKYYVEAAPFGEAMIEHLQAILDLEADQPATAERKDLVRRVSAAEGHLLKSRYAVAAFLASGLQGDLDRVGSCIAECQKSVDRLTEQTGLLTAAQRDHFDRYIEARTSFLSLAHEAVAIRQTPGFCVSEDICLNTVAPLSGEANTLLAGIAENRRAAKDAELREIIAGASNMLTVIIIATAVSCVLGGGVAFLLSRQMVSAIRQVVAFTERLANKDLSAPALDVRTRDDLQQLADSVNHMATSFREVIGAVSSASREVAASSSQISSGNEHIAGSVEQQARQVETILAAVTQMNASVRQVADQADQATRDADSAKELAAEGGKVVAETIQGMDSINDAVNSSARSVDELGKRSEQIGAIIGVINDIADQTNLLALNAAIEAARAGEHGRGFAVVADEVRKLAERTQQATEEVGQSIRAIQQETSTAVGMMRDGTEQVQRGVELSTSAGSSLREIEDGASKVTSIVSHIASAASEQANAADDISRGVAEIEQAAREAKSCVGEAAEASGELSRKAEHLEQIVRQFKI